MRVLSFHIKGKMAHFRRYYSNSSALSYTVPPRTTVVGIIAGLLGFERDSYYEQFSVEQCRIALAVRFPVKKIMQKMNLLMIKGANDLNGSQENHSQTATELIVPQNIRTGALDYQIWVQHRDESLMDKLADLLQREPAYGSKGISLGLGASYNLGWLEGAQTDLEGEDFVPDKEVYISSLIPSDRLTTIYTGMMKDGQYALLKENLPLEFDRERRLTARGIVGFIISLNGVPLPSQVSTAFRISNGQTVMWME